MIRPRNEPSCICRSLCFSGSGDMTCPSQRLSRSCGLEMVARSLVRAPPVAHAPEKSGGNKAQAEEQREAAQNRGAIPKVSSMAVGTPAFVGGQHVMIRPRNEPSCICGSLCFSFLQTACSHAWAHAHMHDPLSQCRRDTNTLQQTAFIAGL
jgi:hypothetical protein